MIVKKSLSGWLADMRRTEERRARLNKAKRNQRIVTSLTASRAFMAVLLIPSAVLEWWGLALALFGVAFLTDMLDGALARRWRVQSMNGAQLDSVCDALLTLCGIAALVLAGAWPWWTVPVLGAVFQASRSLEKRLRGKLLTALIIAAPVVNLTLTAMLAAGLLILATPLPAPMAFICVGVAGYALVVIKQERIRTYKAVAKQRGNDARRGKDAK